MASRFPPSLYGVTEHEARAISCEVCGQQGSLSDPSLEEVFARRFELVHSSQGPKVREEYVCADCGAAFLVGARTRAALAEEDG